jgi:hypothetical protein
MKTTKKQLKEIQEIEKKVAKVCDTKNTFDATKYFEHLAEKNPNDIAISLDYGVSAPLLKEQIKKQGFKISNEYIKEAEVIRNDLHALYHIRILKRKELIKCFDRLTKAICEIIIILKITEKEVNESENKVKE